LTETCVIK